MFFRFILLFKSSWDWICPALGVHHFNVWTTACFELQVKCRHILCYLQLQQTKEMVYMVCIVSTEVCIVYIIMIDW